MNKGRYRLSFTAGSLFHLESVALAKLYLDLGDWKSVRDKVFSENLLQTRTLSTLERFCSEVLSRLRTLSQSEIEFLVEGTRQEQSYLLWLAVCRQYKFIADFAVEVLRERFISLKIVLTHDDFDSFFNQKSEWYDELNKVSPKTRIKLRQILFKMLRDADLLTARNIINRALISPKLLELLNHGEKRDLLYFPLFDSDLKGTGR